MSNDFLKWLEESERITGEATEGDLVEQCLARFDLDADRDFHHHARAAMPKLHRAIRETVGALGPFARMDRPDCDLDEVACQRGVASDMTIIDSRDFRRAALVFEMLEAIIDEDGEGG
jgi:hypothetical protein